MATNAQVLKKIIAARDAANELTTVIKDNNSVFDRSKLTVEQNRLLDGFFNATMSDATMKAIRNLPPTDPLEGVA